MGETSLKAKTSPKVTTSDGATWVCSSCNKTFFSSLSYTRHVVHCKGKHLTCQSCDKKFPLLDELRQHIVDNHKGTLFPCFYENCSICFTTKKGLEYHLSAAHSKRVFGCTSCKLEFDSKEMLGFHLQSSEHRDNNITFFCDYCKQSCLGRRVAEKHISTCPFNPERKVKCPGCNDKVKAHEYCKHLVEEHGYKAKYVCTRCLEVMPSNKDLHEHERDCSMEFYN